MTRQDLINFCLTFSDAYVDYPFNGGDAHSDDGAWAGNKMGKPRAVPYKDCDSDYDDGWMDNLCTERRGEDD